MRILRRGVFSLVLLVSLILLAGCGQQKATPEDTKKDGKTSEKAPVVIGVPTALGSIEGADSLRAVQLAVEEVNTNGGVSVAGEKRPLKVVSIDTREHEPGLPVHDALAAIEKLITQEKPHAILVGSFRSEVLLSAMDLIGKYKIPNIVSIAMSPKFQEKLGSNYDLYKYNFRMGFNSAYLVNYIADTIDTIGKEHGFKKVYFVHQEAMWAEGTASGLKKVLEAKGWTIVGKDAYPTGASDFSSSLTKARDGGAQIIVPVFDMPQSGILLKQARSMQVPALMVGFISPAIAESAWKTFEGEVDGLINFPHEIGPIAVKAVPKSITFNENYGKKFGEEARSKLSGHGPGPAYDSVYALVAAIEKAGSLDADAIVNALKQTDMEGVIGRIKFNDKHQVVYGYDPKETAIGAAFQWVDGKRIPVFPQAAAEGKIQLPAYMK
ncbi:MAG: ABC transporter substrate-binding protein [Clostridia bacterium]|nr:ABC transporter substrate-binding protein [Clostridia bacterium]